MADINVHLRTTSFSRGNFQDGRAYKTEGGNEFKVSCIGDGGKEPAKGQGIGNFPRHQRLDGRPGNPCVMTGACLEHAQKRGSAKRRHKDGKKQVKN